MKKINGKLVSIGTTLVLIAGLVSWNYFGNSVTMAEEKNLVKNGDMEAGNPPDNWRAVDSKLSAETEDAYSGKQSLKIVAFKDAKDRGRAIQDFKYEPGKRYRFEFMYKCSPSSKMYVYIWASGGNSAQFGLSAVDNTWTAYEGEIMMRADLKPPYTAQLGFCTYADGVIFIDDVIITEIDASEEI